MTGSTTPTGALNSNAPHLPPPPAAPADAPRRSPRGPGRFITGVVLDAAVGAVVAGGIVAVADDHDEGGVTGRSLPTTEMAPVTEPVPAATTPATTMPPRSSLPIPSRTSLCSRSTGPAFATHQSGEKVDLAYQRGEQSKTVSLTLDVSHAAQPSAALIGSGGGP